MKNILITIISTVILSITLTGCYNCEDDDYYRDRMVHELETLPPVIKDGSQMELRGETEMDRYTLFFELCANERFDGNTYSVNRLNLDEDDWKIKTATVGYEFSGTYYYRLCATSGDDTIYAENVESFTIENPLKALLPTDISTNGARLHATSTVDFDSNKHRLYFLVSNTLDFSDYQSYGYQRKYNDEDGITEYSYPIDNLVPATSYYCKFVVYFNDFGTTVESNTIEFTTAENTKVPLQIGDIYGYKLNEYGEEVRITDDLKVVAWNVETGQFQGPSIATFDANGNYVWKENNIILEEGYQYFVYAFQDDITKWDNGAITYYDGDYSMGANWQPIYFGVNYGVTAQEPSLKMQLKVRTCQIVVTYPAEWGETEYGMGILFSDIYGKNLLPGSIYNIEGDDFYCRTWQDTYRGSANGFRLSDDKTRYEFRFNIWPTNIPDGYVNMQMTCAYIDIFSIPCPALNCGYGGITHLDLYGVDLNEVTVKPWVEKNGGEIIINPTN